MKFKRTLSLLLTLLIVSTVFTAAPFAVSAAENAKTAMVGASSGTTGDCTWTLDDNGTLTISGDGQIGDSSDFSGMNIESVIIKKGVTSIGDDAFFGCESLTSITIPDSVTSIGNWAFFRCTSLTSITIPNSVTSIGDYAFSGCTSLTSISVNPNNKTYDSRNNCNAIIETDTNTLIVGCRTTVIPDSVTSIGRSAFSYCESLSDVYYGGNETQWNKIAIGNNNNWLTSAAIHFNSFTGYTDALAPVNTNSVAVKTSNGSTLNIELEKDLSFTVPSNVPLIGGKAMKLDLSFVPLTAAVTENSIKIGIGYNRDLTKDTDEQNWCNWKNYVKGYKDAVSKGKGLFDDIKNKKKGVASAGMGKDLDFEFYGYFEGTIQNGQVIGSGVAKIKLEGALKNEWQTAIGFVPIVVKLKGTIGVENNATLSLNFSTKKLSFANQLDITLPQITASAGVGIAHIADVSVYGDAKNVFSIYSKPKKITGTLFGELGVSAKALFWSAKLPILSIGNGSGWTYYDSTKNLFHLRWERLIMMI